MWLKCKKVREIKLMVLVGKSEDNANTLLGDIQAELQFNKRYIHDFGKQYNAGNWQEGQFVTMDGCAFFALGRGQSPRGLRYRNNRPDYIVIDDLDDDELCQNESRVRKLTEWVKEALFGCFGAQGGRFIMVGNLISKCSVLANISKTPSVLVSQVNVLDKNGKPSWPEFWKLDKIRDNEQFMGYRAFQKEYMNNPITEGAVFRNDWIRWKKALPLRDYAELVVYIDPSFKATTKNDYKAGKFWGKTKSGELHQLAAFVRQTTVVEMVRWLYDLYEKVRQADAVCYFYMEANFMQDIILDEFTTEGNLRGYQLPIVPDKRKKPDKFHRVEGVSPLWERGVVFYNEAKKNDPDTLAGMEQLLSFEKGSRTHDDAPDADEGAIYILQKQTRVDAWEPMIGTVKNSKYIW
jgi:predicted phage terminase large subunit-like protein